MEFFLIFLLIIFILFVIIRSKKDKTIQANISTTKNISQTVEKPKIEITVTKSSSISDDFKYPPIKKDNEIDWILNPNSTFQLTLQNCNQKIAQNVRTLLDNNEIYGYRKVDELVGIFSQNNIRVKEVEDYRLKYKPIYFSKIAELKAMSNEWKNSYEADKKDLMKEFRAITLDSLYERPNVDLVTLFENEPKDITIDDKLISEYGFENLQTYLKYSNKPEKIRVFPNGHYAREKFEELEKLNLAERGYNLPKDEILLTLTLRELNKIALHPTKQFKRKKQAVDYIFTKENLDELLGKNISMREIFKLKPLPKKYSYIDLEEIADIWKYTTVVVELLFRTYTNAYYFDRNRKEDKDYVKGYKIVYRREDIHCQCCKEHSETKYTKNELIHFPLHIGCDCFVNSIYSFK